MNIKIQELIFVLIILIVKIFSLSDEFKGHNFLEAVKSGDLGKVKRAAEIVSFVHPLTMDTALVSFFICFGGS